MKALAPLVAVLAAGLAIGPVPAATPSHAAAETRAPVVVVMLENQEDIKLNQTNAPYLMSLKATGRYFSHYYGVVHPSFPNYLAFAGGDTFGNTGGGAAAGIIPGNNVWNQLSNAGLTWGVFEEHVPRACFPKTSRVVLDPTKDKYAIGHNPGIVFETVFTSSTQCANVQPLTAMSAPLPDLSFVTPSYCNDMHGVKDLTYPADCQTKTQALVSRGDAWLAAHVPDWLAAGAIVIVTFDEGTTKAGVGGHIYTVEVGAGISPSIDPTTYNHYSLLAGLEDRFGVTRLRHAADATPLPIG